MFIYDANGLITNSDYHSKNVATVCLLLYVSGQSLDFSGRPEHSLTHTDCSSLTIMPLFINLFFGFGLNDNRVLCSSFILLTVYPMSKKSNKARKTSRLLKLLIEPGLHLFFLVYNDISHAAEPMVHDVYRQIEYSGLLDLVHH